MLTSCAVLLNGTLKSMPILAISFHSDKILRTVNFDGCFIVAGVIKRRKMKEMMSIWY